MEIIITFLIVIFCSVYWYFKRPNYPPGPIPYPFFGNSTLIRKLSKKHNGFHFALIELCKLYKTDILSLKLAKEYTVAIQSEELMNKVLMTEEFQARPDNFFSRLRSMGNRLGITMTDGPHWVEQRTFAFKHMHELGFGKRRMNDMIQMQLEEMLSKLEEQDVNSIILRTLLPTCVLNVLWQIVTGETFKHDEQTLNELLTFMAKRDKSMDVMGGFLNQFPFVRFLFPEWSGYNNVKKINMQFKSIMLKVIDKHKTTYSPTVTRDFIDAFLHEMYKTNSANSTFTEDQLIMVCLDFFIAGARTTSNSLDFLFLHMVLNPDVQEKVHQELDEILKLGEVPSAENKLRCPYTEATILESQRLTTVVPIVGPRRTLKDTYVNGYFIPKDTTVLLNVIPYYRDPEKWENPETMKPERFLDENGKLTAKSELYTFSKGKRRCPGEALAKNCLFIFFAGLLFNYKLEAQDKTNPPKLKLVPGITTSPAEYTIKLVKRFT